jgi:lysyl-tRNA synthetase class 1
MSSSSGNTIGPLEALSLVPPEILRYLIASTKPNKAIEFDTGMGLVTLADEFERTASRDFSIELSDEDLSRRKRVAIEDAQIAVELSSISSSNEASQVTFRHLALLAQTKSDDNEVWASIGIKGQASPSMIDRLQRMRTWIASRHFPEELRITILDTPNQEALCLLGDEERLILPTIIELFSSCEWVSSGIQSAISNSAKSIEVSPRIAYRTLYLCIMGTEKGPRLPAILSELDREKIVSLLNQCL